MSTTENGNDAIAEALSRWLHNQLLRLTLDEIYDEQPDLRPTPERVAAMARRVGITVPFGSEWHSRRGL